MDTGIPKQVVRSVFGSKIPNRTILLSAFGVPSATVIGKYHRIAWRTIIDPNLSSLVKYGIRARLIGEAVDHLMAGAKVASGKGDFA